MVASPEDVGTALYGFEVDEGKYIFLNEATPYYVLYTPGSASINSSGSYSITPVLKTDLPEGGWCKSTTELNIKFQGIDGDLRTDHYLWLAGKAGSMLKKYYLCLKLKDNMPRRRLFLFFVLVAVCSFNIPEHSFGTIFRIITDSGENIDLMNTVDRNDNPSVILVTGEQVIQVFPTVVSEKWLPVSIVLTPQNGNVNVDFDGLVTNVKDIIIQ